MPHGFHVSTTLFALALATSARAEAPRTIAPEDLWRATRVAQPALSPDGRWVAYVATRFDVEANAGDADLWLVPADGSAPPRRLTAAEGSETQPFWSPDSRRIGFLASREGQPAALSVIDLGPGEPQQLLALPVAIRRARWAGDGARIVFEAGTWPDLDDRFDDVRDRVAANKADKTQARISESRVLRYWDKYLTDGQVPHLFELTLATGKVRDLMPGFDAITGFEGFEWDLAADGGEVIYSANSTAAPHREIDFDIFTLDLASGERRNLTAGHPGHDTGPVYAPSGRDFVYSTERRANVASEFPVLRRFDRAAGRALPVAEDLDAGKGARAWRRDGREIIFVAEHQGRSRIYAAGFAGQRPRVLATGGSFDAPAVGLDGIVVPRHGFDAPAELQWLPLGAGRPRTLTAMNRNWREGLRLGRVEDVRYPGHGGTSIQAWLVHPPESPRGERAPALIVVHGGPFAASPDGFSYRWNAHVLAARGYRVLMPNFHGSTGFGQAFADSILGNHGEKPAADVLAARDWLAARPDVDAGRIAVAGGSYGGYLTALVTGMDHGFAAAVVHAGVFDISAQFASDAHWERPSSYGHAPWTDPVELDRWSPSRYSPHFRTPTLILHGEKDYRVPVTQGINLHGVLTGKGVPARIVIFPDENHWILKPQASLLWHREFFAWLERWMPTPAE